MALALETVGLHKHFGGIAAANDVSLRVERGARHALIGPNGAGKTTIINLLTGVLSPSAGSILLEGSDITHLAPHRRVALGLARTFQINQLFGDFTPLESIGLAVSQRLGHGGDWWRVAGSRPVINQDIVAVLERFRLTDVMHQRTATLPYGKQRLLEIALAIACRPRVLLLDEPAAGVPEEDRHEILTSVAALPEDVTVLFIEHDMDLVFSFAQRISVLVNGVLFAEGTPEEVARDARVKAAYSARQRSMPELLALEGFSAGYGEATVISGITLSLAEGTSLALLGRNGMGKTTLLNSLVGVTRLRSGSIRLGGRDITALRPDQRAHAGIGWVPQERNIFRSLTVEENLTVVARPGPWTTDKVYALFPALAERRRNLGNRLSGGEQQMLAIGRALMLNPRLILLDEPLEGLAPILVEELLAVLQRIVREEGLAAIIVEQNARKVLAITDRAAILERGGIVHEADSAALRVDRVALETYLGVADGARRPRGVY